jgi:cell division protein ZapA (FtsZ GTPase activity inhibitor)
MLVSSPRLRVEASMNREEFERRRAERRNSLNFLEFAVVGAEEKVLLREMGRTLDVSPAGIKLETPVLVEAGLVVRVALGLKDDMIELTGKVAHAEVTGPEMFSAGIQFLQMDEAGRRVLERYLTAFRSSGSVKQ